MRTMSMNCGVMTRRQGQRKGTRRKTRRRLKSKNPQHVDVVKVIKGLVPPNSNFAKIATSVPEASATKPTPADEADMNKSEDIIVVEKQTHQESAGFGKAECDGVEKSKTDSVIKNNELTGRQINKVLDVAYE